MITKTETRLEKTKDRIRKNVTLGEVLRNRRRYER